MKTPINHDTFLADSVRPRSKQLSYQDGFRFGFGFFIAGLLITLILAGVAWGIMTALHLG